MLGMSQLKKKLISTKSKLVYELSQDLSNELKFWEYLENPKIRWRQCQISNPEIKLWEKSSKITQRQRSKSSAPVLFFLISLLWYIYFVQHCTVTSILNPFHIKISNWEEKKGRNLKHFCFQLNFYHFFVKNPFLVLVFLYFFVENVYFFNKIFIFCGKS